MSNEQSGMGMGMGIRNILSIVVVKCFLYQGQAHTL